MPGGYERFSYEEAHKRGEEQSRIAKHVHRQIGEGMKRLMKGEVMKTNEACQEEKEWDEFFATNREESEDSES